MGRGGGEKGAGGYCRKKKSAFRRPGRQRKRTTAQGGKRREQRGERLSFPIQVVADRKRKHTIGGRRKPKVGKPVSTELSGAIRTQDRGFPILPKKGKKPIKPRHKKEREAHLLQGQRELGGETLKVFKPLEIHNVLEGKTPHKESSDEKRQMQVGNVLQRQNTYDRKGSAKGYQRSHSRGLRATYTKRCRDAPQKTKWQGKAVVADS